jgi:hypothetical protein
VKSARLLLSSHVAERGDRSLVKKLLGKQPLGRPKNKVLKNVINMYVLAVGYELGGTG